MHNGCRVSYPGRMLRHCVLGGAGFIGSHLCDALLARGDSVLVIDDLSTGRTKNLEPGPHAGRFFFMTGDVRVPKDLGWNGAHFLSVKGGGLTHVWNLACPASPPAYQRDPVGTLLTCVVGTQNALDLARLNGAVMVQASTSEVYGDPLEHPQLESYRGNVEPYGPRACYDEGKRAAEALCHDYRRCHGVDVRVARIFNTYGPRMRPDDGRVVSNFVVQALRGERLTVYGTGLQTRSLCHVDDMVHGLVALGTTVAGLWAGRPMNLGNPHEVTINDLASTILTMVGRSRVTGDWPLHVERRPLPVDDPCRRRPSIHRAQAMLGWEPKITLEDGLRSTIEHFGKELGL